MNINTFFLLLLAALPGCWQTENQKSVIGLGTVEKKSISLDSDSALSKLHVFGQGNVFFTQADKESLAIEADDNLLEYIVAKVDKETLKIGEQKGIQLQPKNPINYYVTFKKPIEKIDLSGAVNFKAAHLNTKELKLELNGASRIDAALQAKKLKAEINGSAKVNLAGVVEKQELEINGSAQYNAADLQSKKVEIKSAGASHVTVSAQDELKMDAGGASTIRYTGDPELKVKKMGAVKIQKIG